MSMSSRIAGIALLFTVAACVGDPPKVGQNTNAMTAGAGGRTGRGGRVAEPDRVDAGEDAAMPDGGDKAGSGGAGGQGSGSKDAGGSGGRAGSGGASGQGGAAASGGSRSAEPEPEPCTPSVPGAMCNLVSGCGCEAGQACYVTELNNAQAVLDCATPGAKAAGSLCSKNTDCIAGHSCIGAQPGGVCRALCESDDDCGAGLCGPVTNRVDDKSVEVEGYRACFERCASNADCATNCCGSLSSGVRVCGAAALCECQSDNDCAGGCCVTSATGSKSCATGRACETVETGAICSSDSVCVGFSEDKTLCVSVDENEKRCAARCRSGSDCMSECCASTTAGNMVCAPERFCGGTSSCTQAGATCENRAECCGGPEGTATCVTQNAGPVCQPFCTQNSQCSTGCCAALENGGYVCAPFIYCE